MTNPSGNNFKTKMNIKFLLILSIICWNYEPLKVTHENETFEAKTCKMSQELIFELENVDFLIQTFQCKNADSVEKWFVKIKKRNKMIRSINGNGKNSISISHWNLGSRKWVNKTPEIMALMDEMNPDFCFLSEANLQTGQQDYMYHIPGYKIITPISNDTMGFSRLVLLAKCGAKFTVDRKKMSEEVSSIWIRVGGRGKNSTLIGGIYREFTLIHDQAPGNSGDLQQQKLRWKKFTGQWKSAAQSKSCWVIGDTNLNYLKWDNPDMDDEYMIDLVKENIEVENFVQVVEKPTRFWPNTESSLLDQIWTNMPESLIKVKNIVRAGSDHNVVTATIRIKGKHIGAGETIARYMRGFDEKTYKNKVKDVDWSRLYSQTKINVAYGIFKEKLLDILNNLAPLRKLQIRKKITPWVSMSTKEK